MQSGEAWGWTHTTVKLSICEGARSIATGPLWTLNLDSLIPPARCTYEFGTLRTTPPRYCII